ncbi:MAG: spore cortex biosynthesis protein YabQ [Vallitalea sp.]|nr:spore cortex biosynthesis protein YabQ [Vallitalea sp.]
MNNLVSTQAITFMLSVLNGLFLGVIYDFIRIFRRIIKHSRLVVNVEDFIFWVFGSLIIFIEIFNNNDGTIRGFLYIGVFLGLILYFLLISKWVLTIFMKLYGIIKKILAFIFKIIIKPIKLIFHPLIIIHRKAYKLLKKFRKWLIIRYKKMKKQIKIIAKKK